MQPERTGPNVLTLRHPVVEAGWSQRYLLIADVHLDSPYCDRRLLRRHLDEARETGAGVLCIGDLLDAMGGRNDPRRSKSETRGELSQDNYLDLVVDEATSLLEPYREQLVMLADGNHETAIRRNLETDLLERICRALNVQHMGYSGWVRFMFAARNGGGHRSTRRLFFHHGYGGGGEVTKGVIQTARRAVWLPDADIVATGHIHEAHLLELRRQRLLDSGRERVDSQWHVCLPTYKQEPSVGSGYHAEKGRPPKPLGGWWLEWRWDATQEQPGSVTMSIARAT